MLAQSLMRGDIYGLVSRADGPAQASFPFGFPLVLAPFVTLFPGQFDVWRVPSFLATVLSATLIFWGWPLLSRRSYWWGLGVTTLFCLSPLTMLYGRLVLSEAVFTAFLLGSLVLVEWGVRRWPPAWWYAVLGALLTLMVYTRTAGWAMLAGIVVYLLYRKGRRSFGVLAGLALSMAFCTFLVLSLTSVQVADLVPGKYAVIYTDLAAGEDVTSSGAGPFLYFLRQRAWQRAAQDIPSTILPGIHSGAVWNLADAHGVRPLVGLVGMIVTALLAAGFLLWLRREGVSALLAVALPYALALLAWDWMGPRLLYPVQMQLAFAFLLGLEAFFAGLGGLLSQRPALAWQRRAIGVVVVLMAVAYGVIGLRYPAFRDYTGALQERASWLRIHTRPDAVIMSNTPEAEYLSSGRAAMNYPAWLATATASQLASYLGWHGVDVVIVARSGIVWEGSDSARSRVAHGRPEEEIMLALAQNLTAQGVLMPIGATQTDGYALFIVKSGNALTSGVTVTPAEKSESSHED